MVGGLSLDDCNSGESVIKVQYITSDVQANYVECQVGALVEPNMKGCLAKDGELVIDGSQYEYAYNPAAGKHNIHYLSIMLILQLRIQIITIIGDCATLIKKSRRITTAL